MKHKTHPSPRHAAAVLAALLFWFGALPPWPDGAHAGENPLKPIDTSSPRSTLQGFMEFLDSGYNNGYGSIRAYLASSSLDLPPETMDKLDIYFRAMESAERTLDLSELPPATARESSRRRTIQLKEILDRIQLPALESIPDSQAMADVEPKRWTLPNSEIRIARIDKGPRTGEYLFDPETVQRLPEFYERVKHLPYRPGATPGWFEFYSAQPAAIALALRHIVPPRWLLELPPWTRSTLLDQPLWRWCGIAAVAGAGLAFVGGCFRLSRNLTERHWRRLLRPLSLVIVAPVTAFVLGELLRVSSPVHEWATLSLNTIFFLALTWAVWDAGGVLAEGVISSERLRVGSIDSQLIRLVLRLLTLMAAVFILVTGADRVGIPAYSVVAGLGVGGLAVALAAQQTLANLLGSLIIMFEKPFAVGHFIKVDDLEGTVESVGFRSTRIRTFYDSLVTIPSSQLVNSTIDNMELRQYRRVRIVLNLTYDSARAKIEAFISGVRGLLESDPDTRKDLIRVSFHDFGPHSLDILVYFFVRAPDLTAELEIRQRILLAILDLAEAQGVCFAFPTRTLRVESLPRESPLAAAERS